MTTSKRRCQLLTLSSELLLEICTYLDSIHSTCFGLTCKRIYILHKSCHCRVPLSAFTYTCPFRYEDSVAQRAFTICYLYSHLLEWKPLHLKYCPGCHRFCETRLSGGKAKDRTDIETCEKCLLDEARGHSSNWKEPKDRRLWA